MKKIAFVLVAVMLLSMFAVIPAFATSSPGRVDPGRVATKADLPDPNDPDSPDEVYVEDEGRTYVKYQKPDGTWEYIPEDEIPADTTVPEETTDAEVGTGTEAGTGAGTGTGTGSGSTSPTNDTTNTEMWATIAAASLISLGVIGIVLLSVKRKSSGK